MNFDPKQAHVTSEWKHGSPLNVCRFDGKGNHLFAGSQDATVERFQLSDGKLTLLKGGHETWVHALAAAPDGRTIVSGGCDGKLSWWEVGGSGESPIRTLDSHQGWIRSVDISPDGRWVASGGNDNRVCIHSVADGKQVSEFADHQRHVYNVRFHPDGKSLFSGDLMGKIHQISTDQWKSIKTLDAKDLHTYHKGQQTDFGGVRGIALNPQKKLLAAGGTHKATNPFGAIHEPLVLIFNLTTGKQEKKLLAPGIKRGVIWRLLWLTPDVLCGVCGGGDGGFLLFWDLKSEKDFHRFKLPNIARDMDFHPDRLQMATAHYDGKIRITRLASKTPNQSPAAKKK